jgi:hypothetical protein
MGEHGLEDILLVLIYRNIEYPGTHLNEGYSDTY